MVYTSQDMEYGILNVQYKNSEYVRKTSIIQHLYSIVKPTLLAQDLQCAFSFHKTELEKAALLS